MENGKMTLEMILSSLGAASTICPPDEYQQRHNLLIRQIGMYLTQDLLEKEEPGEI